MSDQNIPTKSDPSEHEWMLKPCAVYEEEYSDCTSLKARFNQYFIHGKMLDCSQWKRDAINCNKWNEYKDDKAFKELLESEKNHRRDRLVPHYNNNVWIKRTSPPENWNEPLPEYLQEQYEVSYLNIKSKELKGEIPKSSDLESYCIIL